MTVLLKKHYELYGNEALTVGEHIKLYFSELSLSIDKFNASVFNSSIHTVNTGRIFAKLKEKNNFFTYAGNFLPTPGLFDPKKSTFREYTTLCLSSIGLLHIVRDELTRSYKAMKECAATGKLPFSIRGWDHVKTINELKYNIDLIVSSTGVYTRPINSVYNNLSEAESLFDHYNKTVETLKSRDTEVVAKQVDEYIGILTMIKKKVEVSDIKLNQDELQTIETVTSRLQEMVTLAGKLIVMLNDLTRNLELQVDAFKRYIK